MSYEQTRRELERQLSVSREMQIRAEQIKKEQIAAAAEKKRSEQAVAAENARIVEERALASLKSEAAAAWDGSTESFEKAWSNGLADRVREDKVIEKMRAGRAPIADLN